MNDTTPITINKQGSIQLYDDPPPYAVVLERSETLALLAVDCRSKYGEVFGSSTSVAEEPGLLLIANKRTLYLYKGQHRWNPTRIYFPEFVGWEVVLATWTGKSSFQLCLRKVSK